MLFNDAEQLSYEEVEAATGIPEAELKRVLQSLACVKVGCVRGPVGGCLVMGVCWGGRVCVCSWGCLVRGKRGPRVWGLAGAQLSGTGLQPPRLLRPCRFA
jgi:hypothetical protein